MVGRGNRAPEVTPLGLGCWGSSREAALCMCCLERKRTPKQGRVPAMRVQGRRALHARWATGGWGGSYSLG